MFISLLYVLCPLSSLASRCCNFKKLFNCLFSSTTWVSQHQKGKTIVDFNEARDDVVVVA